MSAEDLLISVYPPLEPVSLLARRARRFPFDEPGFTLTHLGRGAVWRALKALGLGAGDRLAMPAYHCGSEVEAARLAGIDIEFYRVDPSLGVDEEDLIRAAKKSDATYLISYFGFPMPTPPPDTRVIEDAAHALFSLDGDVPIGSRGDAAIFCPRKSLGSPDGGGVLVRSGQAEVSGRPPWKRMARSTASLTAGRMAMSRLGVVRAPANAVFRKASKAEAAVEAGNLTETIIGEWDLTVDAMETAGSRSSRLTEWVARGANAGAIRERRRRNYTVLRDELADLVPERFRELPARVAPLYLPIRVTDRDETMAALQRRGVRSIEIWPVPHPLLDREKFADLEPLRHGLIALPVHQQVKERHLEQLTRTAREVLLKG